MTTIPKSFIADSATTKTPSSFKPEPTQSAKAPARKNDLLNNPITRGIQAFFPGKKVGQALGTLGGLGLTAGKEALGLAPKGATKAYDTSAPSPLQTVGDVAKGAATIGGFKLPVAKGVSALGTIGKATMQGVGLGGLMGGGQAATQTSGSAIPTTTDIADVGKGALVGGSVGGATAGAVSTFGQLLSKAGDKITNSVIKPSQADIKDGFSVETVKKYGLQGSLQTTLQKTESTMDDLTAQLNQKLQSSNTPVNVADVYKKTQERLLRDKMTTFGSNTSMQNALKALQAELDDVATDGMVPLTDAQLVKRAAGHYGAWSFGNTDPDATARQKVFNVFYNEMKKAIEDASPEGVREINKQLSELIPVMNAVIRRIPVAERNNLLSLGDIVGLASSVIDPRALGGFALNLASKSGQAGAAIGRTGNAIQRATPALGTGASALTGALFPKSNDR